MQPFDVLTFLLAPVVLYFQYFAAGLFIIKKFPLKLDDLEKAISAIVFGFVVSATLFFFGGQLVGVKVYSLTWLLILVGILGLRESIGLSKNLIKQARANLPLALFAMFAAASLYFTIAFTWIPTSAGIRVQSGQLHDSIWHIALIRKLQSSIPPQHPADYSLILENYHYFYDLLLAAQGIAFGFNIYDLYFRFYPLILVGLLAASLLALARHHKSRLVGWYLLFFTFFGGSFAYFIPIFIKGNKWMESSFWVSQTFAMMVNPQFIFSLSFVLVVLLLLQKAAGSKQRKFEYSYLFLAMIISAASLGFKSYSFIVLSVLLGVYFLVEIVNKKDLKMLGLGVIYVLICLPFLWQVTGFKGNTFFYKPLWFVDTMIEMGDRVNNVRWRFLEDHYRLKGNWPRVLEIKIKEIAIFFVGNLGTRIVFLLLPILLWIRRQKPNFLFWLSLSGFLFASILPLLFLQRGVVWNSIQFWYYALLFANIMAAIAMTKVHESIKNSKMKQIPAQGAVVVLLVALTLPTFVVTVKDKYQKSEVLPGDNLQLLAQVPPDSKTLICPSAGLYYGTSIVSAVSNAQIFLANEMQLEFLEIPFKNKKDDLQKMIDQAKRNPQPLLDSGAEYLVCDKFIETLTDRQVSAGDDLYLYRLFNQ